MKNKLKKDLKFLRTWKGRLLTSLPLAFFLFIITASMGVDFIIVEFIIFFGIVTIISFIVLYFFNAWIVGDEETE